jgi:predicted translin family RNA/ssDNA-binding protein
MSIEQVGAQREYVEAEDTLRQADQKVEELTAQLKRWKKIQLHAKTAAETAVTNLVEIVEQTETPE